MRSRSGIAIAYTGAALIGVAGILLSVVVFLQTAHSVGSQSSRPPATSSPAILPSTGPANPAPQGQPVTPAGPARTTGGGQASRMYPPGEPPGDVEDDRAPTPSPAGPIAAAPPPIPGLAPPLPAVSPPLIP